MQLDTIDGNTKSCDLQKPLTRHLMAAFLTVGFEFRSTKDIFVSDTPALFCSSSSIEYLEVSTDLSILNCHKNCLYILTLTLP